MLQELENENERFVFLDTRGAVKEDEWQDEIHPDKIASKRIANMFIEKIKSLENSQ